MAIRAARPETKSQQVEPGGTASKAGLDQGLQDRDDTARKQSKIGSNYRPAAASEREIAPPGAIPIGRKAPSK